MKTMIFQERIAVIAIALLALVYAGIAWANVLGSMVCDQFAGRWAIVPWLRFIFSGDARIMGEGVDGCLAPASGIYIGWLIIVGIILGVGGWIGVLVHNHRQSPEYLRTQILARKEIAGRKEVQREMGEKTAIKRGAQVRPALAKPQAADVAWMLGKSREAAAWVSMEDPLLVLGPPRSGKGFTILTSCIVEAPGAVVTTSSRGDNMEATIKARSLKGPVYLFDPEGVTGRETTIRWSPITGCERAEIAKKRAMVLVSGTGLGDGANKEWAGKAADILQCLLHAAAIGKASLSELHTWTKSPSRANRALTILENESSLGWAPMLETVLNLDSRERSNQWFGVQSALSALDVPSVREQLELRDGETAFDPETFLKESGTLYMVAELQTSKASAGGAGVFFSLILDDIVAAAHRVAMASVGGRLDPPCALVLDEIANIHPWDGLPKVMAAGSGEGIQAIPVFQSRSQAREGWGEHGERTIWESATRKVLLGGSSDSADLRNLMDLMGNREETYMSGSYKGVEAQNFTEQVREKPVLSADELRRLPQSTALLVAGRARPMLLDMIAWPEREWAHLVAESKAWHKANPAVPGAEDRARTYTKGAA